MDTFPTLSHRGSDPLYLKAKKHYERKEFREAEQLLWDPVQQEKTLSIEDKQTTLLYWRKQLELTQVTIEQIALDAKETLTFEEADLSARYVVARLAIECLGSTSSETPVYRLARPRQYFPSVLSADITETIFADPENLQKEYERLFLERPGGLFQKSMWLQELNNERGEEWYSEFYQWYMDRLGSPEEPTPRTSVASHISDATRMQFWHPDHLSLRKLTNYFSHAGISASPDLYVGKYHSFSIGVVLNGCALDPPKASFETFKSLHVQYAHLPMFTGLRIKESGEDLCLLVLGDIYASKNQAPSREEDWFDTNFVLALHDSHDWKQKKFVIVYRYELYGTVYLNDGSEERSEEPESENPPRFCDGPDAFTVAELDTETYLTEMVDLNIDGSRLHDIKPAVKSIKKPDLTLVGYVDRDHPYIAAFPPRAE